MSKAPGLFVVVVEKVNAPYRDRLEAEGIARCLRDPDAAKARPGHMSSFFGEVEPELQVEFAQQFGIDDERLAAAARSFAAWSGETCALAG